MRSRLPLAAMIGLGLVVLAAFITAAAITVNTAAALAHGTTACHSAHRCPN